MHISIMKEKPVLFLLPGLLSDSMVWDHQANVLAEVADIRIPDLRSFDRFGDMASHVLDEAPEKFSVVGHSMGGRVALELVHLAGSRVEKLALLDVGAHPVQSGEYEERMALVHLAENQGMEALADKWIPPMIHPDRHQDEALLGEIRQMVLRHDPQDYRRHIEAALSREDQNRYLPTIAQHVLLICGEEDEWSPVEQHREIARMIPDAELVIVKDAGHMVTMEQPEAVSALLSSWFTAS